ncbi:hypothetical protein R3P38DRAFT_2655977 [Favolaschia claudopus]|uniref:F-box domain-containing protein n=1 Tax=Favolaschia claudopus TaxID=2862362 RepID=A0AAV9ZYV3_9AGAR
MATAPASPSSDQGIPHRAASTDLTIALLHKSSSVTLATLPADVLGLIFKLLYDEWLVDIHPKFRTQPRFDHERCQGQFLLGISSTCRALRAQTMPWIYREVYNWESARGKAWPESLWPYFRIVHIRDRTAHNPRKLEISQETIDSLSMMFSLVKVTLRLESSIHLDLIRALSLAPSLLHLEIYQARFDGSFTSCALPFCALENLLVSIAGFRSISSQEDVDHSKQFSNVDSLLRAVAPRLTELSISGDLIPSTFPTLDWRNIRRLAITEHPPNPYIAIPGLVANMGNLRQLDVLYTVDISRGTYGKGAFPLFHLGDDSGQLLSSRCRLLSSVTLGNVSATDSIFTQLPAMLSCLRLRAPVDVYDTSKAFPRKAYSPFDDHTLPTALRQMSHLQDLRELCLDLDFFVTAPLIEQIATVLPDLEVLEFSVPRYMFIDDPPRFREQDRDPGILAALNRFSHLLHLRITMNFPRDSDFYHSQEVTARWFLSSHKTLQSVSFAMLDYMYLAGYNPAWWRKWNHDVFDMTWPTPPPTPPPRKAVRIIETIRSL